ncbi:amino acid adenylation domain-containing protein [Tumebacillus lipolyticus]|uniref:Amino acid adenylation domain-containing protein n=1 Tax=Tumebacillus lipolyticus TaxID=1280370 RepID=A0ABW4ZUD6_9BACL
MAVLYAFPVSFSQQRIWVADQVVPGSSAYHMPAVLSIAGELHLDALKRALSEIVDRHEVLRTSFGLLDGDLMQKVHVEQKQELVVIDVQDVPEAERREHAQRLVTEELERTFDLKQGPLVRTTLITLDEQEHLLVIVMHHIVADGWSTGILIKELSVLYTVFAAGEEESPLPPLAVQYADYSQWQQDDWQSGVWEEQLSYWRERLSGELPQLLLPTDRPRPQQLTDRGDTVIAQLSKSLTERLKETGRHAQATLFMTLLAAYQVLLHRYSGQDDVLVGTPIAGRNQEDVQELIGFFLNNLVLRTDLSGDPSFVKLLAQVRQTALEAYQHAEVPFELLVKELQPNRNLNVSPLFQTLLVLNDPLEKFEMPGLAMRMVEQEIRSVKYDLSLEAIEEQEGLVLIWRYKTDLFDRTTIERLTANFEVLLEGIVAEPEMVISKLPLLTEWERQQVVEVWNETERSYPDQTLHQLFEAQVERTPDRVAVLFEGEQVTYREFNERANRVASRLLKLGVRPNTFVGVSMERSIDMLVAVYGVVKAGGAYVPIDPTNPLERVAYMLQDAQVGVLLTQAHLLDRLPATEAQVIVLDREDFSAESADNPLVPMTTDHLAYMIYTSGSTGQPKGAMLPHKAIVNQILWRQHTYRLTESDRILQKTPVSFDASVWELFWALFVGASIVMARSEGHKDSAYLRDVIIEQRVTTLHFVPSMLQIFAEQKGIEDCTSLRRILCGGEALPTDLTARIFSRLPHVEVHNLYGPTEAAVDVTYWVCERESVGATVPVGRHIDNTKLYVLDKHLQPLPFGAAGELHIGGVQLSYGYHNRKELTEEKFIPNPFGEGKLYKSGDLLRLMPNGVFEYLGRLDHQVKVRGFRVELGEIEALLTQYPGVTEAVVMPKENALAAYVVGDERLSAQDLRRDLQGKLPSYMVPSSFAFLSRLPLTPNGKADRRALQKLETKSAVSDDSYVPPQSELEKGIAAIWQEVLAVERVGLHDNFFELGGHSLALMHVHRRLQEAYPFETSVVELFQYPTISQLAAHFHEVGTRREESRPQLSAVRRDAQDRTEGDIAVISMAGRFPGAEDVDAFWRNLQAGVESIRQFSDEELLELGHDPDVLAQPNFVKAAGMLDDIEWFDADFFGINPREAEVMDPQHRIFLETAWQALEGAGYDTERYEGEISIFAGAGLSRYLLLNLVPNRHLSASVGEHTVLIGNGSDHMVARAAYKLDLKGMSHGVSATCSTGMVAIHLACRSLRNGDCDMALAGGVGIGVPQKNGYFHVEGGIASPDGHCRAFDEEAQGTVPGSGIGIVVLKRLEDALADGDHILAVVKGSAVNNDGSGKVGYTAPSVEGQKKVILKALERAQVEPETIAYVEAHGTATPLGDPIELTALSQAFRTHSSAERFCAIGSVKSNIGHLDAAAGAAGFIKTVLALHHQQLPPSLHFKTPNRKIDWQRSPFYVNTELKEWNRGAIPRRAGVSSFGLGGINAHAILEEAPLQAATPSRRSAQLLLISAKTETALAAATARLKAHLAQRTEQELADVAYTLQIGRREFPHRRALVVSDRSDAIEVLDARHPRRLLQGYVDADDHRSRPVAFLFSGTGDHYLEMGSELYKTEPIFQAQVDSCCELLRPHLGVDLRDILFEHVTAERGADSAEGSASAQGVTEKEGKGSSGAAFDLRQMLRRDRETNPRAEKLARTEYAHPALFVIEYALSKLLLEWGIAPQAMIGYSLGEYVAACVAGVFSLEDALALVAKRAQLIEQLPRGAMLAVPISEASLRPLLSDRLAISTVNTANHCVVSGEQEAVAELEQSLLAQGIACLPVRSSHAFHSQMMEPIAEQFAELVKSFAPKAPQIPFVSNVTGTWITAEQATDPNYWTRHLCETVQFASGLQALCENPDLLLLEVGPGQTLTSFALQSQADRVALPTLRPFYEQRGDLQFLFSAIGQLWLAGAAVDWQGLHRQEKRLRVPLPTYPFERKRYWIEAKQPHLSQPVTSEQSDSNGAGGKLQAGHQRPRLSTQFVAPTTEQERAIVSIFEELLGIDQVGIYDSFFQLGGNSLMGTQLISRLRGAFGVNLPLRVIFEAETAAELGKQVARESAQQQEQRIARRPGSTSPLSFSQERIWIMERLAPDQAVYNIPAAVELSGPLDLDILAKSLNEVVARHEVLRSTIHSGEGEPIVQYESVRTLALDLVDYSQLSDVERSREASLLADSLAKRPFDLESDPLLRATAIRFTAEEHLLVLVIHHLVADGWSLGVLIEELATLYTAFAEGERSPLPALPIQYGDYADWQKSERGQAQLDLQLAYWKQQLGGVVEPLALPTDRPRPAVQTFQGARKRFDLSAGLTDRLKRLGEQEGATLFMTLLSAYQTLLARYSGQADILVGSPIAGRGLRETEGLIGAFVNTLVIRSTLQEGMTFRDLLHQVRQTSLDAFAHQDLPFERLVAELQPDRDMSHSPLFQTMFNLLNAPLRLTMPGDLSLQTRELHSGTAKYDLILQMTEREGALIGEWEYNTDLFDEQTIARINDHFRILLESIVEQPDQLWQDIQLLDPAERKLLLEGWNSTQAALREDACLHHLFEEQAERRSDETAIVFEDRELTFGELNSRANDLASQLQQRGVRPDDLVGIYMGRSLELIISLLAVHKAGGAYLPLDPAYPQDRLALMVQDAKPKAILTRAAIEQDWPSLDIPVLYVDAERLDDQHPNLVSDVQPHHLAYMIYTSGSTGLPKGVMVEHRNAVNLLTGLDLSVGCTPDDSLLAVGSISFDVSIIELFWTLTRGAKVVLLSEAEIVEAAVSTSPYSFCAQLQQHRVTMMFGTPLFLAMLASSAEGLASLGRLEKVMTGGEALPPALAALLLQSTSARLFNLYGPTETTVCATSYEVTEVGEGSIPLGRPMANCELYILDSHLQPVPVGVVGELHIGGKGVSRGYRGRQELNESRFLDNPFSEGRLYKTGDLAAYLPDGSVKYGGRIDDQLKVRGFRIEPGEIESRLTQHEQIREAIIITREDALIAYVVAEGDALPDSSELQSFLRVTLPPYMVPGQFIGLPQLPLQPNGKVDRRALPAPAASDERMEHVDPRTPIEARLVEIWSEMLRRETISVHDNFFHIGGHSLLATQLVVRVQKEFQVELPLRDMFEKTTVAELAALIEAAATSDQPTIQRQERVRAGRRK